MKIADVQCSCKKCDWSGTGSDCVLDMARYNPICCPVCLLPVAYKDDSPIIFTIISIEINRDFNELSYTQSPPTVTITFQAPHRFRGDRLLQSMNKRIEIRILEDVDDPC